MESWKQYQKKNKSQKKSGHLVLIVIGGILLICVFMALRFLYGAVTGPKRLPILSGFEKAKWDHSYQFNMFVNPNWIIGYDYASGQINYYQLDENPSEDTLALVSKQGKIILDGYLFIDADLEGPEDLGDAIWHQMWTDTIRTNLTPWQVWRMWWALRGGIGVRALEGAQLPEAAIQSEGLKIAVLNGTSVSGLALEASSWVENLGAKVIDVSNATSQVDKTIIEVFAPEKSYRTIARIEQVFSTKAVFIPTSEATRYDVKITVGNNFLR
ncbi:LytR C-terminal domain-containing protein [candidate division WWE3 bacterium]|nr:LytR C-terminal domain-containing protein [candidate division WWE3 bacterium]